ncbi:MarR family winged helix-turn-helix transcriptional regulator [Apibacter raozihei]|uniref:MarR family winged helix-turn-helix transcriptional regulator n=1 Tax=Apibacter raozihei TaxID=2500547 RepID=UPI0013E3CE24
MKNNSSIDKIRSFNRFYTGFIGHLNNNLIYSNYTLQEVRVLFEINCTTYITAKQIREMLRMDKGYLSRILLKFDKLGILKKEIDITDGRTYKLSLTQKGKLEFSKLNQASELQIMSFLSNLDEQDICMLTKNMENIQNILLKIK